MPLTRIDSAFLDLDAIGGIDFDVQSGVPTLSVDATNHRVGIGTDSPTTKLEVIGDITVSKQNALIELKDPDTADANYQLKNTNGTFDIYDVTNNAVKIRATAGYVTIYPNLNANNGLDVMGTITGDSNLDIDGLVRPGNGTQGAPSHSFRNDTDNGMYRPAVNNIAFVTGGTERIRVNSVGNVGIGPIYDPVTPLHIKSGGPTYMTLDGGGSSPVGILFGDSSDTDIGKIIYDNSDNSMQFITDTTEKLHITAGGNVGINTTAPAQKLDVNGNIKSNGYLGPNTATGSVWFSVGTSTQNSSIALWARDHATYPGQTHILGRTSNASNIAGQIRFYTYNGSTWSIRGMWGKNGYLGIRNSNSDPEVPLHISQASWLDRTAYLTKAADVNFRLTAANGSGTNSSGQETARFGMNYASTNAWGEYIKFARGGGSADGSMAFYSSNTERIHIKADGNVGIGTNNPGAKLHVLGQGIISTDSTTASNDYATLILGERAAGDSIASLEFRHSGTNFSSKIDGRSGKWAVWSDWNSSSNDRLIVEGVSTTEAILLKPGGTVDVVKAEYNTSTGASATYFAGTAHFQRTNTANEGGDIRFSRAVDNAYHYSIDVYGNSTTNPRLRIVNVAASREDFHVTHAGNIGIGTNASSEKLTIHNGVVKLQGTSGGEDTRVEFNRIGGRNGWIGIPSWDDDALMIYGPGVSSGNFLAAGCEGGQWAFNGHNGTSSTEGLRVGQTGNVGIGTNNPFYPLHVQESAYFRRGIQVAVLSSNELQSRSPINSGFYNVDNTATADGWPFTGWAHLLANTHSNTTNYYSQQFASSFFNQELYFRNTNNGSTTTSQSWGQVMHTNSTLKPVYAESDGSTGSWSRYFYPGGEYYVSVHSGTSNDFNAFKEQGYYHVNDTASNAPASGYGYLEIHRHQGSNYFTQKFTLSGDTSRTFFRRGSDSGGTQVFGSWNTYGSLERENTFTNHQNFSGNNYLTFGPNSTWSNNLRIGGNGWQGNATTGTVCVTNGNLHLDAANESGHGVYLNWYGGTSGTFFGDGSSGQIAKLENDGRFFIGADNKTNPQVVINGQANQLILKKSNSTTPSVIHRNDSSNYYILFSDAGTSPSGTWNTLRPLYMNLTSGKLYSDNGQELSGGTKVYTSMNLANIELDFTTANNKYIDFYTANGNTVNFRMPTSSNVFHTGIVMTRNSGVSLYHANSVKLYTTSTGVYVNGSYQPTSDVNLKENIITVPNALDKIKAMRGVKFNWKKDGRPDYGVIAQEAEAVVPELVADHEVKTLTQAGSLKKRPDDSDYVTTTQKGFCYDSMVGILIEAIKEQQATIDSLTARIDALENP